MTIPNRTAAQDSTKAISLRHALATLAYRGSKALREAPPGFANFRVADSTRTPGETLAHLGDLFEWALTLADGKHVWQDTPQLDWEQGTRRFFAALKALDDRLASVQPLKCRPEALFQGPIADAFTHIGQIAMLRRLAGAAVLGENYFKAEIESGRVGPQQAKSNAEFS